MDGLKTQSENLSESRTGIVTNLTQAVINRWKWMQKSSQLEPYEIESYDYQTERKSNKINADGQSNLQ